MSGQQVRQPAPEGKELYRLDARYRRRNGEARREIEERIAQLNAERRELRTKGA